MPYAIEDVGERIILVWGIRNRDGGELSSFDGCCDNVLWYGHCEIKRLAIIGGYTDGQTPKVRERTAHVHEEEATVVWNCCIFSYLQAILIAASAGSVDAAWSSDRSSVLEPDSHIHPLAISVASLETTATAWWLVIPCAM